MLIVLYVLECYIYRVDGLAVHFEWTGCPFWMDSLSTDNGLDVQWTGCPSTHIWCLADGDVLAITGVMD